MFRRAIEILIPICCIAAFSGCGTRTDVPTLVHQGTLTIAVPANGDSGAISGPIHHLKTNWEGDASANLQITEIPANDYLNQLTQHAEENGKEGSTPIDVSLIPAYMLGELAVRDQLMPIQDLRKEVEAITWQDSSVVPVHARLLSVGDATFASPYDGDAWLLYYRKDVLTNPKHTEAFAKKTGKTLRLPIQSWDDFFAICEFFHATSWHEKPDPLATVTTIAGQPGNGLGWLYQACAASFVVNPGPETNRFHNVFFFDPESMTPLIDSQGHARGLDVVRRFASFAPEQHLRDTKEVAWKRFLSGQSLFCLASGDLVRQAEDESISAIKGSVGCSMIPGSTELWSLKDKRWKTLSRPNRVGNVCGENWQGVIFRQAHQPKLAFNLLAFHANRINNTTAVTDRRYGVHPHRTYLFLKPIGETQTDAYKAAGYAESDVTDYLSALHENFSRGATMLEYLRIPGAALFLDSLDRAVHRGLATPSLSAEKILEDTASEWQKTLEELDRKLGTDRVKQFYQTSINYRRADKK